MADLLIKNMEMPSACGECKMVQRYRYSDECQYLHKKIVHNYCKLKDCPLVEVPPHGKLKDADLLQEALSIVLSLVMTPDLTDKEIALVHRTIGAISEAVNDLDTIVEATE